VSRVGETESAAAATKKPKTGLHAFMQSLHIIGPVLVAVGAGVLLVEFLFPVGLFTEASEGILSGLFSRFVILFAIGFTLIVISGHYLLFIPNGITNWQALSMGIRTKYAKLVIIKIGLALGVVSFKVFLVFTGIQFPTQLFYYVIAVGIANIVIGSTLRRYGGALMK